jgi:hypothetical protein
MSVALAIMAPADTTRSPKKPRFSLRGGGPKVQIKTCEEVYACAAGDKISMQGMVHYKSLQGNGRQGGRERIIIEVNDGTATKNIRISFFDGALGLVQQVCPVCHAFVLLQNMWICLVIHAHLSDDFCGHIQAGG